MSRRPERNFLNTSLEGDPPVTHRRNSLLSNGDAFVTNTAGCLVAYINLIKATWAERTCCTTPFWLCPHFVIKYVVLGQKGCSDGWLIRLTEPQFNCSVREYSLLVCYHTHIIRWIGTHECIPHSKQRLAYQQHVHQYSMCHTQGIHNTLNNEQKHIAKNGWALRLSVVS